MIKHCQSFEEHADFFTIPQWQKSFLEDIILVYQALQLSSSDTFNVYWNLQTAEVSKYA